MRILAITLNTLFPRSLTDGHGIFFANYLRNMLPYVDGITAVLTRAYVPGPLRRLPRFAQAAAPQRDDYFGIDVRRPTYLSLAQGSRLWFQGRSAAVAITPLCASLHQRRPFNIVVGQGFFGSSHAAVSVARELGVPCVNWAIGSDVHTLPLQSKGNLRLFRHDVQRSDLVLAVCDELRVRTLGLCPGANNVRTFYWGTDFREVLEPVADKTGVRRALDLPTDATILLSVGHVIDRKGPIEFYQAFRQLAADSPKLVAVWVGEGPLKDEVVRRAQADGLAGRLRMVGFKSRGEVLRYMHAADVFGLCAKAEGLPNVVLEAQASGLPVVATNVNGIPETVMDGGTGFLVPPNDPDLFAQSVAKMLADPARSAEMARRSRAFVLKYFQGSVNAPAAVEVLRAVCRGDAAAAPMPVCANIAPGFLPVHAG